VIQLSFSLTVYQALSCSARSAVSVANARYRAGPLLIGCAIKSSPYLCGYSWLISIGKIREDQEDRKKHHSFSLDSIYDSILPNNELSNVLGVHMSKARSTSA
jgi:hypothetical protein